MTRQFTLSLALTALLAVASYALLAMLGPDWSRFAPATCQLTGCFCEAPRPGQLVLQPANSWSSFSFVLVGAWILLSAGARGTSHAFRGSQAVIYAVAVIIVGVGSFLLHATLTLWGQFYDVVGMYLLSGFMVAYAVQRRFGLSTAAAAALYVALCTLLITILVVEPETRRWLFAVVLLAAIGVELGVARPLRPGIETRWFVYGILLQVAAFTIWILDMRHIVCAEDSLWQGHAAWHMLNAAAIACTYRYYRSERA